MGLCRTAGGQTAVARVPGQRGAHYCAPEARPPDHALQRHLPSQREVLQGQVPAETLHRESYGGAYPQGYQSGAALGFLDERPDESMFTNFCNERRPCL